MPVINLPVLTGSLLAFGVYNSRFFPSFFFQTFKYCYQSVIATKMLCTNYSKTQWLKITISLYLVHVSVSQLGIS